MLVVSDAHFGRQNLRKNINPVAPLPTVNVGRGTGPTTPGGTTPSRLWSGLLGTVKSWWVGCECCIAIFHGMWLPMPRLELIRFCYVGGEGQAGSWVLVFGKVWLCSLVHVVLFMTTFLEIQSWNWIVLLVSAVHFRSSPLEKSWKSFKPMLCDELQLMKDERLQS